jgi:hypothetical protein
MENQTDATNQIVFCWYSSDKRFLRRGTLSNVGNHPYYTLTQVAPSDAYYGRANYFTSNLQTALIYDSTELIEAPDSQVVALPITFTDPDTGDPLTVYGGTVTLNEDGSADLVNNRGIVDLGTLSWYELSYKRFTSAVLQNMKQYGSTDIAPIISSELKSAPKSSIEGADNQVAIADGSIWVCKKTATNATNCKELLAGVQLVYELTTPQTYHFDNIGQLYTYLGTNNVWIDTGAITECDYPADTKTYVDGNGGGDVTDVQINGTSIVSGGVADIPLATASSPGLSYPYSNRGLSITADGQISITKASDNSIKAGTAQYAPIVPSNQHGAAFYGLAKAAGDATQAASDNPVGTYTEDAKSAIHEMLNGAVTVSGTTPTIVAKSGITYVCGEVATLDITPPASGIFEVQFVSGSTPTVLTATGVTWVNGFDPSSLEANATYDISISNGIESSKMIIYRTGKSTGKRNRKVVPCAQMTTLRLLPFASLVVIGSFSCKLRRICTRKTGRLA